MGFDALGLGRAAAGRTSGIPTRGAGALTKLEGETRLLFDHAAAQAAFGASVFWLRHPAAWEGEATVIEYWQVKRGGDRRGIIEIIPEVP